MSKMNVSATAMNEAFCDECIEFHLEHKTVTKEKMKEMIKAKIVNEYKQWISFYNSYNEYVEETYREIIGKEFPDENVKQNIMKEYEIANKRLRYQYYFITFLYANYYVNKTSVVNMHNITILPEIFPLYCDERVKTDNQLYIQYLNALSLYDHNSKLTYAFLTQRFNAIQNLNSRRGKTYEIKRIFKQTGIYFGEERNYIREGVGININKGKRIEGIWENDQSMEGKIICKDYIYIGALANEMENGKGKAYHKNETYDGYFVNGVKKEGGRMLYANGEEYDGEWKNNRKNGKGRYNYNNGIYDNYDGEWKDDKKEGKGTLTFLNYDVYKGEFENDKCSGYGEYYVSTGGEFKGKWVDNYKEGKGVETFSDGDKYEGEYHKSVFEGKGKFTYYNGEVYEGDFKNGLFNGKGKYTWPNGQIYEGDFVNGKCEGNGRQIFIDGSVYEGEFVNDAFEGKGKFKISNGTLYEGEFHKGKMEGNGVMTKNENEYIGKFNGDSISGKGIINYGNGDKYEGDISSFSKQGNGIYTFKNGANYNGSWSNDKANGYGIFQSHYYKDSEMTSIAENPMITIYEGFGIFIRTNGKQYKGSWKDGTRNGQGEMTWPNGEAYEGEWLNEMRNGPKGKSTWND